MFKAKIDNHIVTSGRTIIGTLARVYRAIDCSYPGIAPELCVGQSYLALYFPAVGAYQALTVHIVRA